MKTHTNGGAAIHGDAQAGRDIIGRDATITNISIQNSPNLDFSVQDIAQARTAYLNWIIERNQYLDARGVSQTQRQVQLKLDEVYIGLQAQADERPYQADRRLQKEEIAELERSIEMQGLSPEEAEDRRDAFLHRLTMRQEQPISQTSIPLSQATVQHRHLVILGDPGSGKTTLLRYLALQHAQAIQQNLTQIQLYDQQGSTTQQPSRFPILIRIADYAEEERWQELALSDFLPSYFERNECQPPGLAQLLQQELAQGGCLILLDGLDEIVSADDRRGIVQKIENFVRHHASGGQRGPNHFIITSRIAGYRSAPISGVGRDPFAHFVVQEMDVAQMERFLERWCQAVEDTQTPDLSAETRQSTAQREVNGIMTAIQNNPGVRRLAANPLMLRTLALIYRTGARLPQKRIELYRLAADTLARTWRMAQGVPESVLVEDHYLTPLLGQLAYWMHENKPTGIATEEEVYEQLGQAYCELRRLPKEDSDHPEVLTEIKKFLQAVREHTGLFVESAPRRYGFMHLTFEEYYAARHLVARSRDRARLIRQHLHQPRWEEPILLALGFVGLEYVYDAGDLLDSAILAQGEEAEKLGLTPSPYEDLLGRDYLFTLRCLGDQVPANPATLENLMERMADELLYEQDLARFKAYRNRLYQLLPLLEGSSVVKILTTKLIPALQDNDSEVRERTVTSLGGLGKPNCEVINALIATLDDESCYVREHAVASLGKLGKASKKIVAVLINALIYDDWNVRERAATSLGVLGEASREVISALMESALKDDYGSVRECSTASLGKLGKTSEDILSTLIAALKDSDSDVRESSAVSLGRLGESSSEVINALIDALDDNSRFVREYAAISLGELSKASNEVITALNNAFNDSYWSIRSSGATSLIGLGESRHEVINTLISVLITALNDDQWDARSRAATSLGELGESSGEIITALVATLQDDHHFVREGAAASLVKLGESSKEITSTLISALRDDNSDMRSRSAASLGQLGEASNEVICALFTALQDDDKYVNYCVASSLIKLGKSNNEVLNIFIEVFKDNDRYVREHATYSLVKLDQTSREYAIEALISVIDEPDCEHNDFTGRTDQDYAYDALWEIVME